MAARRMWLYEKGQWSGPLVYRGGDEYGNDTVVFRLPGERALVVAWNVPLRRELEPASGRVQWGLVDPSDGPGGMTLDNPLPVAPPFKSPPPDGCYLVRREVLFTDWQRAEPSDV